MRRAALCALAIVAAVSPAQAMTLREALGWARHNNPNVEEARLSVRSARENRWQARAAYFPSVDVSGSFGSSRIETEQPSFFGGEQYTREEVNPATTTARVTQQLYTGGRRRGQMRLAESSIASAGEELRATEQEIALAVVEAYLRVLRDQEIVRLREGHITSLSGQLQGTQRRLDVGEVSRTDLALAQSRLAGARAALAQARADLEVSRARFEEVVGQPAIDLAAPPAPPVAPRTLEEAVRRAEDVHPLLGQAREQVTAARARVTIERSAMAPQVSLVARADRAEEQDRSNQIVDGTSAVAQVSVPLFEGGFSYSRQRQARLNVERAERLVEAQRREIVSRVVAAWSNTRASQEVVLAAADQVEASATALRGAERERGLGLRSTLDVLDAEREWQEAQIGLARAAAQADIANYVLLAATGGLTLDVLDEQ